MKATLLLTGGTGLIGRALVPRLAENFNIHLVTRSPSKIPAKIQHQVHAMDWDALPTDLDAFDAVINLAGEPIADKRWSDAQKKRIEHSRWHTTELLVSKLKAGKQPPKVLLSASAIGYYGRQDDHPVTENSHQIHDEFTHRLCKTWEEIALFAQSEHTRVCLMRLGVVLSKEGGALSKMRLPFKLGLGGPIASGKQYLSWIHIEDTVSAIEFLLHNETLQGAFNLTAPNPVTSSGFAHELAKAVKRPALFTVPSFALKLAMGEGSDLLIHGQNVKPERLQQAGFEFSFKEVDQALANLKL